MKKSDACRKVMQNMYLILEGERAGSLCEDLRNHLRRCESCAEQYKVLEGLASLCRRFSTEEIPQEEKRRMKESLLKLL